MMHLTYGNSSRTHNTAPGHAAHLYVAERCGRAWRAAASNGAHVARAARARGLVGGCGQLLAAVGGWGQGGGEARKCALRAVGRPGRCALGTAAHVRQQLEAIGRKARTRAHDHRAPMPCRVPGTRVCVAHARVPHAHTRPRACMLASVPVRVSRCALILAHWRTKCACTRTRCGRARARIARTAGGGATLQRFERHGRRRQQHLAHLSLASTRRRKKQNRKPAAIFMHTHTHTQQHCRRGTRRLRRPSHAASEMLPARRCLRERERERERERKRPGRGQQPF